MIFRCRHFEFTFPGPAMIMGIVNVTPDSFSDGGECFNTEAAVARALQAAEQGAGIIDIGGESTRPGAVPVPEAEELRRVVPVIEQLAGRVRVPISIDTMKPAVARAAVAAGAVIVNDVGANRADPEMWQLVTQTGAGYVCMHMKGTPQTMQRNPVYQDVVGEVGAFFCERLQQLSRCGVAREQIILDPGIGFGKTPEHNLQLLAGLASYTRLDRPLLVGVSRKSFLGTVPGADIGTRLPAGLACACLAVAGGATMIRAHDVPDTLRAVRMAEAILARKQS